MVLTMVAMFDSGPVYGTTVPPTPTGESTGGSSGGEVAPELPAPDLPSGSEQGYSFDLRYALGADLEGLPREASVYQLKRETPTLKSVQKIADKVGIDGEVQDRGDGTFEADGNGKLFVSIDQTVYTSVEDAGDGDLPSDEKAISVSRDWLRKTSLLPPDIGDGAIQERLDDSNRVIVTFSPIEPTPILSGYPSITITVGSSNLVLEAQIRWANIVRADVYQLMSADEAWQLVSSGQAFLDTNLADAKIDAGSEVTGKVNFSKISIAYASAGPSGGVQYLEPVYVFEGRIRPEGSKTTYPITGYVSALANSGAPVG